MPAIADKMIQACITMLDGNVPVRLVKLPMSSTTKLQVVNGPTRDLQGIYFVMGVDDETAEYPIYCVRMTSVSSYIWNAKECTPVGLLHQGRSTYMVVRGRKSARTLTEAGKDPMAALPIRTT